MRISLRVALVGGIPISIAAAIAIVAWWLLTEAERARDSAVLAGTVYRNLLVAMAARNDYVNALPAERARHEERFADYARQARSGFGTLAEVARDPAHRAAASSAEDVLNRYVERMRQFVEVTARNDELIAAMANRATTLIGLTDQARDRQRASNADIVTSLTERDRKLRLLRDIVDRAQELRAAVAEVSLQQAVLDAMVGDADGRAKGEGRLTFALARLRHAAADLEAALRADARSKAADELTSLATVEAARVAARHRPAAQASGAQPVPHSASEHVEDELARWADRIVKVNSSEHRALHDEMAQLLTYSVQAHETEQATQNIAITVLKLGGRTVEALAARNPATTAAILEGSRGLTETVASLPISPLIQTEMIEAIGGWRDGLARTTDGLRRQNEMIADMDTAAVTMMDGARSLNDMFTGDADRIGASIRSILLIGATIGLLLGAGTAFVVAGSITRPLKRLQQGMRELAADPLAGPLADAGRRDELGDMARAANFFVTEIGRREQDLRQAKQQADQALIELQKTQADLIQAEKLASLGQLVAGVAHEINTPLGIALTSATLLGDEVKRLNALATTGRLPKGDFLRFVDRATESSQLLYGHLTRAADLVHSFKQVAADQASGERRRFELKAWLHDLVVSLGPLLRKSGHRIAVDCRDDLMVDSYPGALAQILTNLVMNSVVHAYDEGQAGTLRIAVEEPQAGLLRLAFSDDGRGIAPSIRAKVFDPFFTTGRSRGSTGLGLHIVYNLVTRTLLGRIELESAPGPGTRFVIEVPVSVARDTAAAA